MEKFEKNKKTIVLINLTRNQKVLKKKNSFEGAIFYIFILHFSSLFSLE